MYLTVLFIEIQCRIVGFAVAAPRLSNAYARSVLVQLARYLMSPKFCLYFVSVFGMYSSLSSGAWYSIPVLFRIFLPFVFCIPASVSVLSSMRLWLMAIVPFACSVNDIINTLWVCAAFLFCISFSSCHEIGPWILSMIRLLGSSRALL